MTERTIAGFAVGDRVGPKLNDCYGKVTQLCDCIYPNTWCCNIEMECTNMSHHHCSIAPGYTRRTWFPADELEHID
jgi:hypothetical protein